MRYLPVVFTWCSVEVVGDDGTAERRLAMVPLTRYMPVCRRQFVEGEEFSLAPIEARSRASHNQYFAALHDGFSNLPEDLSVIKARLNIKTIPPDGFIDAEHLRKWALCETGWCDIDEFDFDTPKHATDFARFCRKQDTYAQILIRGAHVTVKIAKSQSAAAMSKEPFEQSKRAVLDLIETMIGVKKGTLNKEAGKAA